jgi:hypothetical protein
MRKVFSGYASDARQHFPRKNWIMLYYKGNCRDGE